jgi:hypothetical protein
MVKCCVSFAVRAELLNITWKSFGFKGLIQLIQDPLGFIYRMYRPTVPQSRFTITTVEIKVKFIVGGNSVVRFENTIPSFFFNLLSSHFLK